MPWKQKRFKIQRKASRRYSSNHSYGKMAKSSSYIKLKDEVGIKTVDVSWNRLLEYSIA